MRTGTRASTVCGGLRRQAGAGADHRRDESVEGEDRRGRKSRQHRDRLAVDDREAERLAGLERDAVHEDAGLRRAATRSRCERSPAPFEVPPDSTTMSQAASARRTRLFERGVVVREGAERHRLAAGFGDRGGDDRAVAVVDAGRAERLAGATSSSPVESTATLRPAHHLDLGEPAGRQHADLARADARAAPQQRLAARDVGAGIGDELAGRGGAAQVDRRRAASSISSVCSIITTASAPRGITPPVAIVVAVPGATSSAGGWPQAITSRVETQPARRACRWRRRCRRRAARSRRHWRGRTAARRSARRCRAPARGRARAASATRLGRQRRQIEMPREARARLLGRDDFEELLLPRGAADGGEQIAARRDVGVRACRHGQGLTTTSRAGRIALAVGRHQNPAVGLRQRRQRQIARALSVRAAPSRSAPGPLRRGRACEATLRVSVAATAWLLGGGAAKPRQHASAEHQPDRQRRVEPAGQQQHRPRPDEAEAPRSRPARGRCRATSTLPTRASACTLVSLRPLPVPPTAMIASAVSSCSASSSRASLVPCSSPRMRPPAAATSPAIRCMAASITSSPAALTRTNRTRGSQMCTAHPRTRQDGGLNGREAPALPGQGLVAVGVGSRRQHAFADRDRCDDVHAIATRHHDLERRHCVGVCRQGFPDVDPRRARQRRRRIGAGVGRELGAYCPAVA